LKIKKTLKGSVEKYNDELTEILEKTKAMEVQGFEKYSEFEDKFEVIEYLGKGATCKVYQVIDKKDSS